MIYNRFGWVMLCLVAVQSLVPSRDDPSRRRTILERTILGIALACLAFTKLNYFAAGILVSAAGCVLFPQSRRGVIFAIVGFTAGTLFFSAFLGFDLPAYYSNVHDMLQVVSPGSRYRMLLRIAAWNIPFIAVRLVFLCCWFSDNWCRGPFERGD